MYANTSVHKQTFLLGTVTKVQSSENTCFYTLCMTCIRNELINHRFLPGNIHNQPAYWSENLLFDLLDTFTFNNVFVIFSFVFHKELHLVNAHELGEVTCRICQVDLMH